MRYALISPTVTIEERRKISGLVNAASNNLLRSHPDVKRAPGERNVSHFCIYCNHPVTWGFHHGGWSRFHHGQDELTKGGCEEIARILEIPFPLPHDR